MSAPDMLNLRADQSWRSVPMPGANLPFDLVRLASPRDRFTILGRFPAGFDRSEPGGYTSSEEVLVLDGDLTIEGVTYGRGDLAVVPAMYLRRSMSSVAGCRVLAWFGGPALFQPPDELEPTDDVIMSLPALEVAGPLLDSPVGAWGVGAAPEGPGPLEVVDSDLGRWQRGADLLPAAGDLARRER